MLPFLPVLLTLAVFSSRGFSQVVLTQSDPVLKAPGEAHKLTCAVTGFNVNNYWMGWMRQKPGQGLEWLVHYYNSGNKYYLPTIQGRFTASKDSSNFYLQMNNLKVENTAIYYCAREAESGAFDIWGKGTSVVVTSDATKDPSILPLWPCCSLSTEDSSMVTFTCLLIEYGTKSLEITWEPNTSQPKEFSTEKMSGENLFTTSQLTVSSSSSSKIHYKCSIKDRNEIRPVIFTNKYCIFQPLKPVDVQILTPSCGTQSSVVNVELVCFLRSLSSGKAKVEWLKNGVQLQEKEDVALTAIVGKGSGYSSFIHLNISKESWDKGDLYTCKVTRPPGSQNVTMQNASKCQVCYGCMHQPTMSFTKPSYKSLLDRSAILVCTVISSNLENAQITWLVDGKPSSDVVHGRVTTDANGSQKLRSNHSVSLEQWTKGTIFTCKVTGSCFEEHRKEITIEKATRE